MPKEVKKGELIPVKVTLEFEGTVRGHKVEVAKSFFPIGPNQTKEHQIPLNGNPILISVSFGGMENSGMKKFEVEINEKKWVNINNIKLNAEDAKISFSVPYSKFDLVEASPEKPVIAP